MCDALTANLEERCFFRVRLPCSHAEVMTYLSACAAAQCLAVLLLTREAGPALAHSLAHPETLPTICAFSVLGYLTVCLVLLLIKHYGSTSAEVVKSMRKVCQVLLSFALFPKPLDWKYVVGGALVAAALYSLQSTKPAAGKALPPLASGGGSSSNSNSGLEGLMGSGGGAAAGAVAFSSKTTAVRH